MDGEVRVIEAVEPVAIRLREHVDSVNLLPAQIILYRFEKSLTDSSSSSLEVKKSKNPNALRVPFVASADAVVGEPANTANTAYKESFRLEVFAVTCHSRGHGSLHFSDLDLIAVRHSGNCRIEVAGKIAGHGWIVGDNLHCAPSYSGD